MRLQRLSVALMFHKVPKTTTSSIMTLFTPPRCLRRACTHRPVDVEQRDELPCCRWSWRFDV